MLFKDLIKLNIPDVVLSNKLNNDVIDIVLDYIEANTNIAYDITKVFTNENTVIKNEFVNTYLENISSAFENALFDQNIQEKLTKVYADIGQIYDPSTLPNIADLFTDEYLNVSKAFKQRKGTIPAIKFAYNTMRNSKIQGVNVSQEINDAAFNVKLGSPSNPLEPFMFQVEGTLYEEVYENSVKAIVHPVGFGYVYAKILALLFTEYVNVKLTYKDRDIKVKCNNGAYFVDYSDKDVKLIFEEADTNARVKTTVLFVDGTYLIRDFNTTVKYYNADNTLNIQYPDACALYLSYTLVLESAITEEYSFILSNNMQEYYRLGSSNIIGPDLIIGAFIISGTAELYNTQLIYDDNRNTIVMRYPHAPIIGPTSMTIGNNSEWVIGHASDILSDIGEDNYLVYHEVSEDFSIELEFIYISLLTEDNINILTSENDIILAT